MKWTTPDTTEKATGIAINGISNRSRLMLSALIRCSTKKRKLGNDGSYQPGGRQVSFAQNTDGNGRADVHQGKKMRPAITREELSAIQTQLAILSDGDGDRPIHIAVANENLELVRKLCLLMVKNSISLDITNHLRQTPLHLAVMLNNIELIRLLLSFGASPLVSDRNGNSVLHLAVKSSSDKEVLDFLLSRAEVKNILNSVDYEGYSPLHYAVFKNNSNAVQVLHTYGADMNKIDGKSGRTALIHAVLEQNTDMVDLLLNSGACPQKLDYSGRSAFEMALQITSMQIVQLLEKWMPQSEAADIKEKTKSSAQHSAKTKRTKNSK